MSRIGNLPVAVPKNVKVQAARSEVTVTGPKGTLTFAFRPEVQVETTDGQVRVRRSVETKLGKSVHGLTRAVIRNMVIGVTEGYQKELEVFGTGYRVAQAGKGIQLQLGFSHPVEFTPPTGVTVTAQGQNRIIITGADKQAVGQVAAQLRAVRPPDPYKGKGVRYAGEVLKLKPGKAAARK
jgi:large subunit ribosomal protein L6